MIVHDKRLYVAGRSFLLDDVYLMQKLGLRPEKKEKDRQRMYKLAKMISKTANVKPTDDINTIYNHVHNKIQSMRVMSRRKGDVKMALAAKVNPLKYKEYTTNQWRTSFQANVYGVKHPCQTQMFQDTHDPRNQRFNLNKQDGKE